ncbi:MAG: hypothetical protein H0X31_08170 [Nostocaceae cyanobacterium]|nr:hypothetical protein [Nostocaceae cyanobacterium]
MVSSQHGHPIWFLVTALAGAFFLIFLSQIIPTNNFLLFLGKNTLVLLGLNGLFRDLLNPIIVQAIPPEALNGHFQIIMVCSLITILSLIVCIPGILFFNKFFPQLIGKPKKKVQFYHAFYQKIFPDNILTFLIFTDFIRFNYFL